MLLPLSASCLVLMVNSALLVQAYDFPKKAFLPCPNTTAHVQEVWFQIAALCETRDLHTRLHLTNIAGHLRNVLSK